MTFVVIYAREPHARQMAFKDVCQPVTWEERRDLAKKTREELQLDITFLVDDIGDPSRKIFGDVPNPAIFVDVKGRIEDKLSWADSSEVERALLRLTKRPDSARTGLLAITPPRIGLRKN